MTCHYCCAPKGTTRCRWCATPEQSEAWSREDEAIRALWLDDPDSEAKRAARSCPVCGHDGPVHNAHICGRLER